MLRRLLAFAAGAASCYRAPQPDCGFFCGPDGSCPADYSCNAKNVCIRNGASGAGCPSPIDARIDAYQPDAETPVHLLSTFPADGATGVAVNQIVIASVDEYLYGYDTTSFSVGALGIEAAGDVDFVPSTNQLRFVPSDQYRGNTMYTAIITTAITNGAGAPLGPHTWTFTTGDDTLAPRVKSTTPSDGATQVPITSTILVQFDEAVTGVDTTSYTVADGATPVAGTITSSAQQNYTFQPTAPLVAGDTITVSLSSAIQDVAGNALVPVSFSFTTAP